MNYRNDFIKSLYLELTQEQIQLLERYVDLVWEKKETLNLTSVADKQEIWDRHIMDGLAAASIISQKTACSATPMVADYGAGAGYIGIVIAVVLDWSCVTLIESLERRCMFLEWVTLKLGLKNIKVSNIRAGNEAQNPEFDFTTERAMGKIDDILPLCTKNLKEDGYFLPYQSAEGVYNDKTAKENLVREEDVLEYTLPSEEKIRKIIIFKKYGYNSQN